MIYAPNHSNCRTIGQGKSIILCMPKHVGLYELMIKNLEYCGFKVFFFSPQSYQYKSVGERLNNFFRKNFLKDAHYKKRQQTQAMLNTLHQHFTTQETADYALFIRPDIFPTEVIQAIQQHSHSSVAYQWDGLEAYPAVFDAIPLFDRFFVFDKSDIKKYPDYNLRLLQNFYFDFAVTDTLPEISPQQNQQSPIIYFVGSHSTNRLPAILNFLIAIKQFKVAINFLISHANTPESQALYSDYPVVFIAVPMSYAHNLSYVKQADVLVDFIADHHKGLSLRFFEAIAYQKKLITTNPAVIEYDFYHPKNILIWDGCTLDPQKLDVFLTTDYHPLSEPIISKYAFSHWIEDVLNDKD